MTGERLHSNQGGNEMEIKQLMDEEEIGQKRLRKVNARCGDETAVLVVLYDQLSAVAGWSSTLTPDVHSWTYATVDDAVADFEEWARDVFRLGKDVA